MWTQLNSKEQKSQLGRQLTCWVVGLFDTYCYESTSHVELYASKTDSNTIVLQKSKVCFSMWRTSMLNEYLNYFFIYVHSVDKTLY